MKNLERVEATSSSYSPPSIPFNSSDFSVLKNLDAAKSYSDLPDMTGSSIDFKKIDLSKISLTTPAQDASTHAQPDYYLNSEGKLVKNPLAKPNPHGTITIEVEGNNSAKKAEQYANKLQKETIQHLIEQYKRDNPGAKIPEMWQAIIDADPDPTYTNDGDSQNNTTVTADELNAYKEGKSAPPDIPPADNPNPPSIPQGQPGEGAPSTGPGAGTGSGGSYGGDSSGAVSNLPNQVTGNGGASMSGLEISFGSMANYDGDRSHMNELQKAIVAEAVKDLGSAMWGGWSGASAEEGCAASVSQILNDCGAASLHNAQDDNCDGLQADLLAQGWTLTDKPQPGDVWIGRGGASSAHTGIIGENNTLMDNHSGNGLFSTDSGNYTRAWTNSVFLKPPDKSNSSDNNGNSSGNSTHESSTEQSSKTSDKSH